MSAYDLRMRSVAAGYALGWSFLELRDQTKIPRRKGWQTRERETRDDALAWARAGNVGIRTGAASGVYVLDEDTYAGAEPLDLPKTVAVITGGGGRQHYFRDPGGLRNSASSFAPHWDTRGDGGQAVYPGSIHPDTGRTYEWEPGCAPWETPLAELPPSILARLTASAPASRPRRTRAANETREAEPLRDVAESHPTALDELRRLAGLLSDTGQGKRHSRLYGFAWQLGELVAGGNLRADDVRRALEDAARICGLSDDEGPGIVSRTIEDGLREGAVSPRKVDTADEEPVPRVSFADADQALEDITAEAIQHAEAGGFATLEPSTGVGKTRKILSRLAHDPRFAFLAFSFDDLAEKEAEAAVPVWIRRGYAQVCRFPGAVELASMHGLMRRWRDYACNGGFGENSDPCPHRAECPVMQSAPEDLPLFAPHAGLDYIDKKSLGSRIVVIDEIPAPIELLSVPLEDVARARFALPREPKREPTKFHGWPEVMRHVQALAVRARATLEERADTLRTAQSREAEFPLYLDGSELAATWASYCTTEPGAAAEVDDALAATWTTRETPTGGEYIARDWPYSMPSAKKLRDLGALGRAINPPPGRPFRHPNLDVLDVLEAVAALKSGPSEPSVIAYGFLSVVREPNGATRFELRKRKPYLAWRESTRGVVLLAADAEHRLADVQALAGDRPLRRFRLDVDPAPDADCSRIYMRAEPTALSRSTLLQVFNRGDDIPAHEELNGRGAAALRKVLARTARRARRRFKRRATAGLIAEKPVADAIRAALGGKALGWKATGKALEWREELRAALDVVAEDLDLAPERVLHYGAQRGRNTLAEVDVLVLFGAPVPNLGEARADGRALGAEPEDRWKGLVRAELYQGEGRARPNRPGRQTVIVAASAWEVPGNGWDGAERQPLGRIGGDLSEAAEAVAREHLAAEGLTCRPRVEVDLVREGSLPPPEGLPRDLPGIRYEKKPSIAQPGQIDRDRRKRIGEGIARAAEATGAESLAVPVRGGGIAWATAEARDRLTPEGVLRAATAWYRVSLGGIRNQRRGVTIELAVAERRLRPPTPSRAQPAWIAAFVREASSSRHRTAGTILRARARAAGRLRRPHTAA